MTLQFIVGIKLKGKTDHIVVAAEDALIAALRGYDRSNHAGISQLPGVAGRRE